MKNHIVLFLLTVLYTVSLGQPIANKMKEYADIFPVEKIYAHTNKTIFTPGETLYFSAYITNTSFFKSLLSETITADLINPAGQVISSQRFIKHEVSAHGSIRIPIDAVGGQYTLKISTAWSVNMPQQIYAKEITVMRVIAPRLLMKLDIGKEAYGNGDTVNAELHISALDNNPISHLDFDYQVQLDGETYRKESGKTDARGRQRISFSLPNTLVNEHVSLNVIFRHNHIQESITRTVPIVTEDLDVQFLPEGGFLLSDQSNIVAFKALNKQGNPADVKGNIYDERGQLVTPFASFHQGMGKFKLLPSTNKTYYALITSPYLGKERIPLPAPKQHGQVIQILNQEADSISFHILSNQVKKLQLIVRSENKIYVMKTVSVTPGLNASKLSTKELPLGILSIALAQNNQIISERLFFNKMEQQLDIAIETDKQQYASRELVSLRIKTKDHEHKAVPALLSLSVVDDKILSYLDDKQHNILTWSLLGSNLKGNIYEPEYYFNPTKDKRAPALDMLLLTQGWRNYDWESVLGSSDIKVLQPHQLHTLRGQVKIWKNDEYIGYPTTLYVIADSLLYITKTDKMGFFSVTTKPTNKWEILSLVHHNKDYIWIEQLAKNPEQEARLVKRKNMFRQDKFHLRPEQNVTEINDASASNQTPIKAVDFSFDSQNGLEEVVVGSYAAAARKNLSAATTYINNRENLAHVGTSDIVSALAGRVSGLSISPSSQRSSQPIAIRGMASFTSDGPLIVIDGVPLHRTLNSGIADLNFNTVQNLTVLENAEASAIYGSQAANGVILIRTHHGSTIYDDNPIDQSLNRILGKKFQYQTISSIGPYLSQPDAFYYPKYETAQAIIKDDFRDNLYWNYHIETDRNGEAEVSFYTSDDNSLYRVIAEGLSTQGTIGQTNQTTFSVTDPYGIDLKLPLYASQGDTIKAPFWIKNQTKMAIRGSLELSLPPSLSASEKVNKMEIAPKSTTQKHVALVVKKPTTEKENMRFVLTADQQKMGLIQNIRLFDKGFPLEFGQSTASQTSFTFPVNHAFVNTQMLQITLYNSPVKQITDGLSRIIREPHGCFEQVSSSVYPNIYALHLLKQMNTDQPLQDKLLAYLNNGYKKLANYEIKGGGFDWYGKPPAHEVLSAFGLIEFIEMQPLVAIDSELVERTKKWLISKKDKQGGFKQTQGRYAFSGSRKNINNTYITYALSIAGLQNEIELEYQTAKQEALASEDLYRTALVALTAHELQKDADYHHFLLVLKKELSPLMLGKAKIEGSITSSLGKSLQAETAALVALVFEKQTEIGPEYSQVINFMIEKSNHGYFGSTQATGLSLKAISQYYARMLKSINADQKARWWVTLDGDTVLNRSGIDPNKLSWTLLPQLLAGKHTVHMGIENMDFAVLSANFKYISSQPPNHPQPNIALETSVSKAKVQVGENTLLQIKLQNNTSQVMPMTLAKIGIPGGLSPEPTQLREIMEKGLVDYFEIFDNYLVFYWREFGPDETKNLSLDLKAQVPGNYTGAASSSYLYYTEENKHWNEGIQVEILQD